MRLTVKGIIDRLLRIRTQCDQITGYTHRFLRGIAMLKYSGIMYDPQIQRLCTIFADLIPL